MYFQGFLNLYIQDYHYTVKEPHLMFKCEIIYWHPYML